MGIKGIYKEIGLGERVSLCKLATEHLEETERPFRLAIDISIWQFQVQAARGGSNPAIRTLFYRLVRLLGHAIEPLFVFDGPNKPAFKRNKRSAGRGGDAVATAMAKRLIRLFGFAIHDAPGEAEAECALLQQQGIVDAVLSEDVDTIMFGCRRTLRNWTAEGAKGSKTPTHVSVYDAAAVKAGSSGLDREGMVLVALMSGGDYLPEGVPGCGVKVACEAARAGFGLGLCQIKMADKEAMAEWKGRLLHELRTNERGFFRTKHRALEIPEGFPNMEILRYYTHPVVSRQQTLERLKREFPGKRAVDVTVLREFVRETFDWTYRIGAIKFIRVLAPSLLVHRLLERSQAPETDPDDLDLRLENESVLIKAISSRRAHFSTDSTPELRVSYVPADIVGLDLSAEFTEQVEVYGRNGLALNSDDEFDEEVAEELDDEPSKTSGAKKKFDPSQPDLVWIPEFLIKSGVPLVVGDWEEMQRAKELRLATKTTRKPRAKKTDMPVGALDKFVKVTKNITAPAAKLAVKAPAKAPSAQPFLSSPPRPSFPVFPSSPPAALPPLTRANAAAAPKPAAVTGGRSKQPTKKISSKALPAKDRPAAQVNPWTIAGSQVSPPRVTKTAAAAFSATPKKQLATSSAQQPICISSSPPVPAPISPLRQAMTGEGITTPKGRVKRVSSPPVEDLFSPEPLHSLVSGDVVDAGRQGEATSPVPRRQARTFKRTKSGMEDDVGTSTGGTQRSIKDYGHLVKGAGGEKLEVKSVDATRELIELSSGDEGGDDGDVAKQSVEKGKTDLPSRKHTPSLPAEAAGHDTVYFDTGSGDDDDLFGLATESLPLSKSFQSLLESNTTPPPQGTALQEKKHYNKQDRKSLPDVEQLSRTTGTTKLYMPRTSGVGAGFFTEVEVTREEADFMMKSAASLVPGGDGLSAGTERVALRPLKATATFSAQNNRKIWRRSEIPMVDLTEQD
ncbi:hypothetical protein B0H67DRAFT_557516 [Lasiosphaeris hirsuta]|uniref:Flap structure-specific endonuclease n=1 Tax=Lasiosphaeris hirsuta TaxID=260670 RepID=A0AA39ZW53_9PEZI|nr:hypothetical protein B0H67DRAFT_557516 [Lasiosphaeris hirsuta]